MQSTFALLDSSNGEFYVGEYGYAIKTNINNLNEKTYLNSLDSANSYSFSKIDYGSKADNFDMLFSNLKSKGSR